MRPEDWVRKLKTRMGYPVINLATTDDMIQDIIDTTIEKLQPYMRDFEYFSALGPTIDLRDKHVYAVIQVYPTRSKMPTPVLTQGMDEFSLINYAGIAKTTDMLSFMAIRGLFRSELQALNPEDWKLIDGVLYISGYTGEVTIQAITEESTYNLDQTYQQWAFDYSLALLKQVEGEIRSKVQVVGAPVQMNGKELKSEGLAAQQELEQKLGTEIGIMIATR